MKSSQEKGSFHALFTLGYLIALSPLAGILLNIAPIHMICFISVAMSVWIILCLFLWVREHRRDTHHKATHAVGGRSHA